MAQLAKRVGYRARIDSHSQEANVVHRPIAPGPSAESLAPLGYRGCRELFFALCETRLELPLALASLPARDWE